MLSRLRTALCCALWLTLAAAVPPAAAAERPPVVVELFTSQGCNSCPPADALLGELAGMRDVIALSLHVDYWDYIGWADPFGSPEATKRQRDYARRTGARTVYTPQMMIDGRIGVIGSRRDEVLAAIAEAARQPKAVTPRLSEAGVHLPTGPAPDGGAVVWLIVYDSRHATEIARGENAGLRLENHHVVREWRRIGEWRGQPLELPLDAAGLRAAGRGGVVVLVQAGGGGPIIGAAELRL